jgi:hypothetical protein
VAVSVQSQICGVYPPLPSKSNYVQTIAILMLCVTLPFLILRTLSRWLVSGTLWLDDWVMIVATGCFIATAGLEIAGSFLWSFSE